MESKSWRNVALTRPKAMSAILPILDIPLTPTPGRSAIHFFTIFGKAISNFVEMLFIGEAAI
jgi:hypothetical protein